MPTVISGTRRARSIQTPTSAGTALTQTLDFNLSERQGVEILGIDFLHWHPDGTVNTAFLHTGCLTSIHLETGTVEDLPHATADSDGTVMDSEVLAWAYYESVLQDEASTRGGSAAVSEGTVQYWRPPERGEAVYSARNLQHRAETLHSSADIKSAVLVHYRFVEFSLAELGWILARQS